MEKLGTILLLGHAEVEKGLEMAGETAREGDVVAVAARADVFVEGVFVVLRRKFRTDFFLKHTAKLAHRFRAMRVSQVEFHLPLWVEIQFQSAAVVPCLDECPVAKVSVDVEPSREAVVGGDAKAEVPASVG